MPDDPYVTFIDEPPRHGAFHNATIDPSRQHQCSLTAGAHEYDRGPVSWPTRGPDRLIGGNDRLYQIGTRREPLEPHYTEKLNRTSPRFPTVSEAKQRRRDFWSKVVARGGIAMMVAAPFGAIKWGTGIFPAGAFVVGGIIFIATCFVNGNCRRL